MHSITCDGCGSVYYRRLDRLNAVKCPNCHVIPSSSQPENRIIDDVRGHSRVINLPKGRIKSLQGLLDAADVNLAQWGVERHKVNKWEVGAKDEKGRITIEELWQVTAWMKQKKGLRDEQIKELILEQIEAHALPYPVVSRPPEDGLMLEIGAYDLHLGKLAWGEESGEDQDLGIAADLFEWAVGVLISKASAFPIEKILFPIGQDFFHFDTQRGQTSKGTELDVDSRWLKMFRTGTNLCVWAIDHLREIAPVEVLVVPGNHEEMSTISLGEYLAAWYRQADDVVIDNSAKRRKYVSYGVNLLGFCHPDQAKLKDLPMIMASEAAGQWSASKIREIHVGHFHQRRTVAPLSEHNGVVTRILPSLSATDAWHYKSGYVGNLRSAEGYLWSKTGGLSSTVYASLLDWIPS